MGSNSATGGMELATNVMTVTFNSASTTSSSPSFIMMLGQFNASLSGTWGAGIMSIQKSYDGGTTFIPVTVDTSTPGSTGSYTSNVSVVINEPEPGVYYRWQPTSTLTSGTVTARISGGPRVS